MREDSIPCNSSLSLTDRARRSEIFSQECSLAFESVCAWIST